MATNLYETLELAKDATPEQIRKAYKKRALQTHPDRLPPNATQEDKAASEDLFRKVNNAYEVLIDAENRKKYDLHGVWPPPESPQPRRNEQSHRAHSHFHPAPFADPFFGGFHFSDPFSLFDTIFGMDPHHRHSFRQHRHRSGPWVDPFEALEQELDDLFDRWPGNGPSNRFGDGLGPRFGFGLPSIGGRFPPSLLASSSSSSFSEGGNWASESFSTTTVNGITQSVHKRRDWDGNEHVTRTYPDGRKIRTINGVEQPSDPRGYLPEPLGARYGPLPASAGQSRRGTWPAAPLAPVQAPPPPYPGHAPARFGTTSAGMDPGWYHNHHHDHHYSDSRPVIPDTYPTARGSPTRSDASPHRRRWWHGRG